MSDSDKIQTPKASSSLLPNQAATVELILGGGAVLLTQDVPWTRAYFVSYDGNGNDSGTIPVDNTKYLEGSTATVLDNSGNLEKANYYFGGWTISHDGSGEVYKKDDTILIGSADITLYAKWIPSRGFDFF